MLSWTVTSEKGAPPRSGPVWNTSARSAGAYEGDTGTAAVALKVQLTNVAWLVAGYWKVWLTGAHESAPVAGLVGIGKAYESARLGAPATSPLHDSENV